MDGRYRGDVVMRDTHKWCTTLARWRGDNGAEKAWWREPEGFAYEYDLYIAQYPNDTAFYIKRHPFHMSAPDGRGIRTEAKTLDEAKAIYLLMEEN